MLDIILFFVLMTFVYASIGVLIIGDLDGEIYYDPVNLYTSNSSGWLPYF